MEVHQAKNHWSQWPLRSISFAVWDCFVALKKHLIWTCAFSWLSLLTWVRCRMFLFIFSEIELLELVREISGVAWSQNLALVTWQQKIQTELSYSGCLWGWLLSDKMSSLGFAWGVDEEHETRAESEYCSTSDVCNRMSGFLSVQGPCHTCPAFHCCKHLFFVMFAKHWHIHSINASHSIFIQLR